MLFLHPDEFLLHGACGLAGGAHGDALGAVPQILTGEVLHGGGHGGRIHEGLAIGAQLFHDTIQLLGEAHVQHAVRFVHDDNLNELQPKIAPLDVIAEAARGGHDDLGPGGQGFFVVAIINATDEYGGMDAPGLAQLFEGSVNLLSNLPGGRQDKARGALAAHDVFDHGQGEGRGFAGTGTGGDDEVFALQRRRYGGHLHIRRGLEARVQKDVDHFLGKAQFGPGGTLLIGHLIEL